MGSYIRDRIFVEDGRNLTGDFEMKQINIQRSSTAGPLQMPAVAAPNVTLKY